MDINTDQMEDVLLKVGSMVLIKKCVLPHYNNSYAVVDGDLCVIVNELDLDGLGVDHLTILRTKFIEEYEYICVLNSYVFKALTKHLLQIK